MGILVFGATGQVARELQKQANVTALSREDADLRHPEACAEAVRAHSPSLVINAAAYTAVDKAESDEVVATIVNAQAPGCMARCCATRKIPFLHLSTDYVFDGSGDQALTTDHRPNPQTAYGRSKHAGELAVKEAGGQYLILRTAWVFSAYGSNFVKTMLKVSETNKKLRVVNDQVGCPTPAFDIANALLEAGKALTQGHPGGTFHFAGQPTTSWAGFADAIFALARRDVQVARIATTEYPTPATRPLNSRLDCTTFTEEFGMDPPDWQAGLSKVIMELEGAA